MKQVEDDIKRAIVAASKSAKNKKAVSLLHLVSWFRIILDEAHLIKVSEFFLKFKPMLNLCKFSNINMKVIV